MFRFLISGPGLIGKKHAEILNRRNDCVVAAIVAPPSEENMSVASALGAKFFEEVDSALDRVEVDAVIVSSPNAFHYTQVKSCIERRIPVLSEKPLTDKLEDARALVHEAERWRVPVLVGHHRTYSPLLAVARDFMESARFGQLVSLQGSALFYKPAHYFAAGPWRSRVGGGPILINLIHEIGLMRFFAGEIQSVSAYASNRTRHFEVEDTVSIALEFADGALGTFLLSDIAASDHSWEMTSGENPAYPFYEDTHCYHFAGTRGSLDFPTMHARFYSEGVDPSWWTPFSEADLTFVRADPLELQIEHFVAVLNGTSEPQVSIREGYLNMLVIEAIRESIATGHAARVVIDVG